ncbi:hypothetical protein B0J15DRAFT_503977 [Fusarium solani]|uniref:Secreted protein n=1 Tax=Fusarium solani TaxID=169388 RepID=A0A9P9G8W7_FUSSL|nr:uncharacterized protein B0J15DRAFT_503977 [Fusarium solani]KAH7235158.1 hypothetical protein B0J15DRAFT_503977 [Fusarium solani]
MGSVLCLDYLIPTVWLQACICRDIMQPCFIPHHGPNASQLMKLHPYPGYYSICSMHYVDGSRYYQGTANIRTLCSGSPCAFMLPVCSDSLGRIARCIAS